MVGLKHQMIRFDPQVLKSNNNGIEIVKGLHQSMYLSSSSATNTGINCEPKTCVLMTKADLRTIAMRGEVCRANHVKLVITSASGSRGSDSRFNSYYIVLREHGLGTEIHPFIFNFSAYAAVSLLLHLPNLAAST